MAYREEGVPKVRLTDLGVAEWTLLAPLIRAVRPGRRPAVRNCWELGNVTMCLLCNGCT